MVRRLEWLLVVPWRLSVLVAALVAVPLIALRELTVDRGLLVLLLLSASYLFARSASQLSRQRRALDESLERESATGKVLQVMTRSAFDIDDVFRAILTSAIHICDADWGTINRSDGEELTLALQIGGPAGFGESLRRKRSERDEDTLEGRVVLEKHPIHVVNVQKEFPRQSTPSDWYRTALLVPMLREERVIGAIGLYRYDVAVTGNVYSGAANEFGAIRMAGAQPSMRPRAVYRGTALRPFSDREIDLVETFADQAAIAIENVRLFNETKEALERQTATSEVLEAISRSTSDLQPVFDIVVERSLSLCDGDVAWISQVDAGRFRNVAFAGSPEDRAVFTTRQLERPEGFDVASDASVMGMVLRSKDVVHLPDLRAMQTLPEAGTARRLGVRAVAAVPIFRGAEPIGAVIVGRKTVRPFSEREVALLRTFADQSVIAIENVRLFNETKEALDRQTATGEVLKVISRSAFDLQRVLDTVIESATKLTNGSGGTIWRLEGEEYRVAASSFSAPDEAMEKTFLGLAIRPHEHDTALARAARSGVPVQVEDVQTDPGYRTAITRDISPRTVLAVPLLREGVPIGVLVIGRQLVRPFNEKEIELAANFADQAVIAIENTRLLNEIQEKSQQLEAASRHKSEFLANMSHELRTPLNAIIGFSDVLGQKMFGELNEKQNDYLNDIGTSGRHLLDLVNQILDLSKVEAGRMELEPSAFAPGETIRASLAFVRDRAAAHRIQVAAEIPPDLPTVTADERKIRQVLLNLLSNAVKFTPDGGRIGVAARAADGELEISVKDTGIGIPLEDQSAVFEEFRQFGQGADRSREGTGLGLTLAKRFVELHGGRIWVESAPGTGSTFTFAIPVERPAAVVAG